MGFRLCLMLKLKVPGVEVDACAQAECNDLLPCCCESHPLL